MLKTMRFRFSVCIPGNGPIVFRFVVSNFCKFFKEVNTTYILYFLFKSIFMYAQHSTLFYKIDMVIEYGVASV